MALPVRHAITRLVLLHALVAPSLLGQRGPARAQDDIIRVDTLHADIRGMPAAAGTVIKSVVIRHLVRGMGTEAGFLIRVADTRARGEEGGSLHSWERTVLDATTRGARSTTTHVEHSNGQLLTETQRVRVGDRVRSITIRPSGRDTTWVTIPPGTGPLFVSFEDVLWGLPPDAGPGTRRELLVTTPPYHQTLVIDSYAPPAADGRRVITGHIDSAGTHLATMRATVRPQAHEVVDMEWRMSNGVVSALRNVSGRGADASAAVSPAELSASRRQLAGTYRLRGEREMASQILLRADGRFTYALAYGAMDEEGAGTWRPGDGDVVLQSDGVARAPSVTLQSARGTTTDSVVVLVVDTAGMPVHGIEVDAVQPRRGTSFARTSRGRHVITFAKGDAPTELSVGYDVLNFMVNFPIDGKPKAVYRFVFDRGDLGRYRFEGERLSVEDTTLVLVRNGHRMRYVRD